MSRCCTLPSFILVDRKQKTIHVKHKHGMALMLVQKPRPLSSLGSSGTISVDNDPLSSNASSESSHQRKAVHHRLKTAHLHKTLHRCKAESSTSTHDVQLTSTQSNNITTNDDIATDEIPANSPSERIRVRKRRLAEYETKMDMIKATYLARKEKIKAEYEAEMRRVKAVRETIAAEHAAELQRIKSEHNATIERINSIKSELGKLESI